MVRWYFCTFPRPSTHCYKLTRDTNPTQHSWTTFLGTSFVNKGLDDFYRLTISTLLIGQSINAWNIVLCAQLLL